MDDVDIVFVIPEAGDGWVVSSMVRDDDEAAKYARDAELSGTVYRISGRLGCLGSLKRWEPPSEPKGRWV